MKYILISVYEREIFTKEFFDLESARRQMMTELKMAVRDEDKFTPEDWEKDRYEDIDGGIGWYSSSAYVNDGANFDNYDWAIICVE